MLNQNGRNVGLASDATITDDEFIADFTRSGPQARGPVNCTRTGVMGGMRTILKALTTLTLR